jgi:elongation factor G
VGSAGHHNGIMRLMKALRHEAPALEAIRTRLAAASGVDESALAAVSFHAYHRRNVGKTVLVRGLVGGLKQGSLLAGSGLGSLQDPTTGGPLPTGEPAPGAVFAAVKSEHLPVPFLLTTDTAVAAPGWTTPPTPIVARILVPGSERDEGKLAETLAKLAETDQGLTVMQDEATGAQLAYVQGPMHLRDLCRSLSEVFHLDVTDTAPGPAYRETISRPAEVHYRHRKQTGGAGQFADVTLSIRPNERGGGFTFTETVKGGAVPRNFIPAVEAGAREAMDKGPLGFKVIDVGVTLTDGQHHSVDSSEFAFRVAGRMGVKQALSEALPALMQPIYRTEIHVPSVHSGSLVPIVSALKAHVLGFDADESAKGWDIFMALVPGSALDELARSLRSVTRGIGYFSKTFDHFEEVHLRETSALSSAHGSHANHAHH